MNTVTEILPIQQTEEKVLANCKKQYENRDGSVKSGKRTWHVI